MWKVIYKKNEKNNVKNENNIASREKSCTELEKYVFTLELTRNSNYIYYQGKENAIKMMYRWERLTPPESSD